MVVLCEALEELPRLIDPTMHRKYVVLGKNGMPILYVKLQRTIYRYISTAILLYDKLYNYLHAIGFVLNP